MRLQLGRPFRPDPFFTFMGLFDLGRTGIMVRYHKEGDVMFIFGRKDIWGSLSDQINLLKINEIDAKRGVV